MGTFMGTIFSERPALALLRPMIVRKQRPKNG